MTRLAAQVSKLFYGEVEVKNCKFKDLTVFKAGNNANSSYGCIYYFCAKLIIS
ncbi:hypothetical protein MCM1_3364 [Methanosarcina barkeri CM1]|uniref:Uncharacterized protein n=1 Tax=Methanosarcina barkeri CM1 TaxID=796385 RepID=A0A0G3CEK3_METBA|nr:hypothetical protein MCM1_3364 [Methanosarcina barkeri CM1]